jgi:protein O-GlcNAc transferase
MGERRNRLDRARAALASGNTLEARRVCGVLLLGDPADVEARHLSGRCHAALGEWESAAAEFARALEVRPDFYRALLDLGIAQALCGRHHEAYPALLRAHSINAHPAELHLAIGLCEMEIGDLRNAVAAFHASLARKPGWADALNNLGVTYDRLGDSVQAVECFREAIAQRPQLALAWENLADILMRLGRQSEANSAWRRAAELRPTDGTVQAKLGTALLAARDFLGAAQALESALALNGRLAAAATNLGEALRNLNAPERAEAQFLRALSITPDLPEAYLGLGKLAAARGDSSEAALRMSRAVELSSGDTRLALGAAQALEEHGYLGAALIVLEAFNQSDTPSAETHDATGKLLLRMGRTEAAVASCDKALTLEPAYVDALLHRGQALESLGRHEPAIESFERALALKPEDPTIVAALASCAYRICDWTRVERTTAQLRTSPEGLDALHPFLLLATDLSSSELGQALQRRGSRIGELPIVTPATDRADNRLRIAYVSPDFREHPVARCLAGVIKHHDRNIMTPIAISLCDSEASDIGQRLRSCFDEFIDASALSDLEIVTRLRRLGADVVIDLAGHTIGARPGVFARRAAPVQINYLGFPGSTGHSFMDYIVADEIVIPQREEHLYSERVLRMPHCYLPFDDDRPEPGNCSRLEAGLPPEGFVFCAFNNAYKITRSIFALWMSLLREIPGSVLWLRSMGDVPMRNLLGSADAAGIEPTRLIAAPYLAHPETHIARLKLADLFLDTLPYNAHSSAAEALWAGVPVLTCQGRTFAGRVGASLLTGAGIPELISEDIDQYRTRALELARSPSALAHLRSRLEAARRSAPLFDTGGYTRNLETLLSRAHADCVNGVAPATR